VMCSLARREESRTLFPVGANGRAWGPANAPQDGTNGPHGVPADRTRARCNGADINSVHPNGGCLRQENGEG